MDRRDFLKMLGVGGLVLSVGIPKIAEAPPSALMCPGSILTVYGPGDLMGTTERVLAGHRYAAIAADPLKSPHHPFIELDRELGRTEGSEALLIDLGLRHVERRRGSFFTHLREMNRQIPALSLRLRQMPQPPMLVFLVRKTPISLHRYSDRLMFVDGRNVATIVKDRNQVTPYSADPGWDKRVVAGVSLFEA